MDGKYDLQNSENQHFQSCHVGLYLSDCFLLVVTEQLRGCGLETQREGRPVSTSVKDKYGLWKRLVAKGMGSCFETCLIDSTFTSKLCVCAYLCVCVASLVMSRKKLCDIIYRYLNTLNVRLSTHLKSVRSGYLAAYLCCFLCSDDSFRGCSWRQFL